MDQSIAAQGKEQKDNEEYSKNFARIPNMLFTSFKFLSKEEKFLYCALKCIYWDAKPRFVSLRELSEATEYSTGALSKMLPRLHKCALINAEIKRERGKDGKEKGNPKYQITILDIWELNRHYFSCSRNERELLDPSMELVHEMNEPVHENTQGRSPNDTRSFTKSDKPVHQMNGFTPAEKPAKRTKATAKDFFKDPLKTSLKKEERTLVPSTQSSSSLSLSTQEEEKRDDLLKWLNETNVTVSDTPAAKGYVAELRQHINSCDKLHKLYVMAQEWNQNKKDKTVYLGNLANKQLLDAFLQAEQAMQSILPTAESTPTGIASESQIEALAAEIQTAYPELVLRLSEDTYGPYVDVLYGDESQECYTVRDAEDWSRLCSSQKRLERVRAYGSQCCFVVQ